MGQPTQGDDLEKYLGHCIIKVREEEGSTPKAALDEQNKEAPCANRTKGRNYYEMASQGAQVSSQGW